MDVRERAARRVQLALSADAAEVADEDFGPTAVKRIVPLTRAIGSLHSGHPHAITFDCANPELAMSRVLGAKGAIRVARGDQLRARIADELDAVEERYLPFESEPADA